jgi:hypothetical protein
MARSTGKAVELILKSQLVILHHLSAGTVEGPEKEVLVAAEMEVDLFLQGLIAPRRQRPKRTRARRTSPPPDSAF